MNTSTRDISNGVKQPILFIAGAGDTGSSALLGLLNCHPDIFLFFESDLYKSGTSKYAKRFLETYPDARYFMGAYEDIGEPYARAKDFLKGKGYDFKIVGDKIHGLEYNFDKLEKYKIILIVRDIKTWLAKEATVAFYSSKQDAVPSAYDYTAYLLNSFRLPDVLRLSMEDFMLNNQTAIGKLSNFLGLDLNFGRWWEKIDKQGKPKDAQRWWKGHPSSLTEPKRLDIKVDTKPHAFWDIVLPIFNKYYQNLEKKFSVEEIDRDLAELKKLRALSPVSLASLYDNFYKTNLVANNGQLSGSKKFKRLARKVADKLYYEVIKLLR